MNKVWVPTLSDLQLLPSPAGSRTALSIRPSLALAAADCSSTSCAVTEPPQAARTMNHKWEEGIASELPGTGKRSEWFWCQAFEQTATRKGAHWHPRLCCLILSASSTVCDTSVIPNISKSHFDRTTHSYSTALVQKFLMQKDTVAEQRATVTAVVLPADESTTAHVA